MLLTAALVELGAEPDQPTTTATRDGDGWRIDGVKSNVPGAHVAESVLVPATAGDDVVDVPRADERGRASRSTRQETMNHEPLFEMRLDGVRVGDDARLGAPEQGREILTWTLQPRDGRDRARSCRGVADQALRITAQYTTDRKQFDRADRHVPGRRAAHGRLLHRQPGDRAHDAAGRDAPRRGPRRRGRDRDREVLGGRGGNRIGHAALHIHGGISIDLDYPIHRYFLWLKQYEFTLGSATPSLLRIGKVLADEPVAN